MKPQTNPFIRGYQNLKFDRVLMITYEDDCPPCFRPLHASQAHLPDDKVQLFPCIFCDDFALITEGQTISDELELQCQNHGVVRTVVYGITADDFGTPIHVGDTYTVEAARKVIDRLSFETGIYSRCWEISSAHLPASAMSFLERIADSATTTGLLFQPFRIAGCPLIGCKLICTPWTDQNLLAIDGINAKELRHEQLRWGVPEPLVKVLHLAALADSRFLIFDADAPVLKGLPVYDK